ncbi:MAG: BrnT family toxin [Luteolibacter sp.]
MKFEFDEKKSRSNLEKHGIDFSQAQILWLDPKRLEVTARSESEPRFALIALYESRLWTAIFTLREERIRIISVRRSRHEEEQGYYQC